ncbi:MAG: hypothetical protein RBU23_09000 [Candidatus Auribacterota bacterium]|jgi:hypothetical protein|nr:hypothetical protein [Candidatus Auribacterota bacterium]
MKNQTFIFESGFVYAVAVLAVAVMLTAMLNGCSTVPPEQEGSSIPWAQPEQWENSQLKTGVGF